jgi:hypothetical protein
MLRLVVIELSDRHKRIIVLVHHREIGVPGVYI